MIVYKQLVILSIKQSLTRGRGMKRKIFVLSAVALAIATVYCSAQTNTSKSKAKPRRASAAVSEPDISKNVSPGHPVMALSGACTGETSQILAEHGTVWGYNSAVMVGDLTHSIYDKLVDYYTCAGLAQRNGDACNALPYFVDLKQGYDDEETPRSQCRTNLVKLLYLTGKENAAFCKANLHIVDMTGEVFCSNMKDMAEVCGKGAKLLKENSVPPECYRSFPRTAADCGANAKCRRTAKLYGAIRNNSGEGLSPYERASFTAYQTKTTNSCQVILKDLSATYCKARNAYAKLLESSSGAQSASPATGASSSDAKMPGGSQSVSFPPPAQPVLCTTCQVYRDQLNTQKKAAAKGTKPAVKK